MTREHANGYYVVGRAGNCDPKIPSFEKWVRKVASEEARKLAREIDKIVKEKESPAPVK